MQFWLGTHLENWLSTAGVPLMVSHRRLKRRKRLPVATTPWVCDSGGFTELNLHGRWTVEAAEYVDAVERYAAEIGKMEWAAPRDWMCEPFVIEKTGLSVDRHQRLTVEDYLDLTSRTRTHIIPVLQGWTASDYWAHVEMYLDSGVDLRDEEIVGLGSVCRRANAREIVSLVTDLHAYGLRMHGFGVKRQAIQKVGPLLESADSMAWSFNARKNPPLPGCTHQHCNNCLHWALRWREGTLALLDDAVFQPTLEFGTRAAWPKTIAS